MEKPIRIGVQSLHTDELLSLKELFREPGITLYTWHGNQYDPHEIRACDVLVLFAKKHWPYLKFDKPYLLILADYVSETKAIDLSKSRFFSFSGYRYRENTLFRGYLCGSEELLQTAHNGNVRAVFYPKKYPFAGLYADLAETPAPANPRSIITLINHYAKTAAKLKWSRPENSYRAYRHIAKNTPGFDFNHFGAPARQVSFEESVALQFHARYTLHVKYWGHVCNAVVKSLALGTPVIMDEVTFRKGRYGAYIRHGENGLVFKDKHEIIRYLCDPAEKTTWQHLKNVCLTEAPAWHFPYTPEQKDAWKQLL